MSDLQWGDGPIILAPLPLLLQFFGYEQHYPDFPKNMTPIIQKAIDGVHETHDEDYKGAFIAMTVIASMFVFARLWTRKYYHGAGLWWDDYLIIVGMIFTWLWTAVAVLSFTIGGVGLHVWESSFHTLSNGLKFEIFDQVVYNFAAIFTKMSILVFILRLTPPTNAIMFRTIIITMVIFCINFVVQVVMILTACRPARAGWELADRLKNFDCLDWFRLVMGQSIVWSCTDLWNLLLPIPLVWHLSVSAKEKIAMVILFGFGGVAVAASVVKIFYLYGVYHSWDPTWYGPNVLFWFHAEVVIGLITACLPALGVFLVRLIPILSRSTSKVRFRPGPSRFAGRFKAFSGTGSATKVESPSATRVNGSESYFSEKGIETVAVPPDVYSYEPDLGLVPKSHAARIATAVTPLHPPERDNELYLHYPLKSLPRGEPIPALRPLSHVRGNSTTPLARLPSPSLSPVDAYSLPPLSDPDTDIEAYPGILVQTYTEHAQPSYSQEFDDTIARWAELTDNRSSVRRPSYESSVDLVIQNN